MPSTTDRIALVMPPASPRTLTATTIARLARCAYGRYTSSCGPSPPGGIPIAASDISSRCRRRASAATPITVTNFWSFPIGMNRFPSGSSPGHIVLAELSLTIATRGAFRSSCHVTSRPRSSGIPMFASAPGFTLCRLDITMLRGSSGCRPSGIAFTTQVARPGIPGPQIVADLTPGRACNFSLNSIANCVRTSGVYLSELRSIRSVSRSFVLKPRSMVVSRWKLLRSNPAPTSNTRASPTSHTISIFAARRRRRLTPWRPL